eukprot:scaffold6.g2895.t1
MMHTRQEKSVDAFVLLPTADQELSKRLLKDGAGGRRARAAATLPLSLATARRFVAAGDASALSDRRRRHRGLEAALPAASVTAAAGLTAKAGGLAGAAKTTAAAPGLRRFLAGGVAGAVSKSIVAPLERISTMLMLDPRAGGMAGAARAVLREGGAAALWRGNSATVLKIFPASAVQFSVFHSLSDALLDRRASAAAASAVRAPASAAAAPPLAGGAAPAPPELGAGERLLAGAAAGAAAVAVTYPLESLRTLMSAAGGVRGSLAQVAAAVVASQGPAGLYRGFSATLVGDMLGSALGFALYEGLCGRCEAAAGGRPPPPAARGALGAAAAAAALTATMPLEVARRRLQVQGALGRPVLYRGTLHCLASIARDEGAAGFFAASLPLYLKVAPSIGCMYMLFEVLMQTGGADPGRRAAPVPASAK